MYGDVTIRLLSFGYTVNPEKDDGYINILTEKVTNEIKNNTNQNAVPVGLYHVAVDMVCGEFLQLKLITGQLDETGLNTAAAIKAISEGDTSITYAVNDTAASPVDILINWLLNHGRGQFTTYRRLAW